MRGRNRVKPTGIFVSAWHQYFFQSGEWLWVLALPWLHLPADQEQALEDITMHGISIEQKWLNFKLWFPDLAYRGSICKE